MIAYSVLPSSPFPASRQQRRRAAAGLLTLALHGALLLWLSYRAAPPPPLPAAQPMLLLAVAEQAESVPDSEKRPTGVRQVQAIAAQAEPTRQTAPQLTEAPDALIHRTTAAAQPDKTPVEKQKPPKRPVEKALPNPPSRAAAAPDTSAPPPMAGKTVAAPRNQAAAQPSRNASAWSGELLAHLSRYKRYPAIALRQQRQGVAQISITLDRQGRVLAVKLLHSSGVSSLDRETTELPLRASPVPPPPPEMAAGMAEVSISLPVRFDLKEARK
ncbi:TonB family protein [Erwinia sp. SLM-02]|uniref:TonB family protein n=1 Tax=Erwinia sp. SLM-02 TaxID=3020057 RepID=UPI0028D80979|nr:TonB family protein [uncultured Erwinia sp.]